MKDGMKTQLIIYLLITGRVMQYLQSISRSLIVVIAGLIMLGCSNDETVDYGDGPFLNWGW